MKKTTLKNLRSTLLLALLAVLTLSCQSPTHSTETSASSDTPINLTAMMAPFTPKTQTFTVSGKKPSIVTGKAGTKIHVEPNNLTMPDGSPIQGDNIWKGAAQNAIQIAEKMIEMGLK